MKTYSVTIVKYTGHTSLNRIEAGLKKGLETLGADCGVKLSCEGLVYDGQADPRRMAEIGRELAEKRVDLVFSIATPTTVALKGPLEQAGIPLIFYAVSDPISAGVIRSFDHPGRWITGISDGLDGALLVKMMLAAQPELSRVGLLYDAAQISSRTPVAEFKAQLDSRGIRWTEATPADRSQVPDAARALLDQGVQAILTPTDNTIMSAELDICDLLSAAGVGHYTGSHAFTINGAFFGLGGSYQSGDSHAMAMARQILLEGKSPNDIPVVRGDHGLATVNRQVCEALGFDGARLEAAFAALGARTAFLDTQTAFAPDSQ